jgi:hypothetical protein
MSIKEWIFTAAFSSLASVDTETREFREKRLTHRTSFCISLFIHH